MAEIIDYEEKVEALHTAMRSNYDHTPESIEQMLNDVNLLEDRAFLSIDEPKRKEVIDELADDIAAQRYDGEGFDFIVAKFEDPKESSDWVEITGQYSFDFHAFARAFVDKTSAEYGELSVDEFETKLSEDGVDAGVSREIILDLLEWTYTIKFVGEMVDLDFHIEKLTDFDWVGFEYGIEDSLLQILNTADPYTQLHEYVTATPYAMWHEAKIMDWLDETYEGDYSWANVDEDDIIRYIMRHSQLRFSLSDEQEIVRTITHAFSDDMLNDWYNEYSGLYMYQDKEELGQSVGTEYGRVYLIKGPHEYNFDGMYHVVLEHNIDHDQLVEAFM